MPGDIIKDRAMLGPGGAMAPPPNEKKQNIKYIKLGFEFSYSIFVQYFQVFTKSTLSLFKFSLNFDFFF